MKPLSFDENRTRTLVRIRHFYLYTASGGYTIQFLVLDLDLSLPFTSATFRLTAGLKILK